MSLYTRFISGVLFPIHEIIKGHDSVKVRKSLEKTQWLSRAKLDELQLARLRKLLINASINVPYYRDLFAEINFSPESISCITDLQELPFLTKPVIRKNIEQLKSDKAINLQKFNTGGSSGKPLIFFIGKGRVSHDVAAKWRATRWWGVDIGDKEVVVWGSPIELGTQDRVRLIRDRIFRTKLLSAFEMSENKLDGFVAEIQNYKPTMLFGYPSSLSLISSHAKKRNERLNNLGIKVAFVTSEKLFDHQKDTIEEMVGCQVANGYGGRDAGFIAHACPEGSMHITAEDIVLEIVDENGAALPAGQVGEIVVTHLATADFPFIRYKTGDMGAISDKQCSCGRGLPILEEIQGRTTDFIVAKDGTILHALSLIYEIRDVTGVEEFKIVQETINKTIVYLIRNSEFSETSLSHIRDGIMKRLGQDVEVEVQFVKQIPLEKSGKFRYVISKVDL